MSLDVYLTEPTMCPHCAKDTGRGDEVFWRNITHNLNTMADAAGVYAACWRPDEHGMTHARDLIEPLRRGLADLKARPEHFKRYNAPNGWGVYENFVEFVECYLEACEANPSAVVRVSL